MKLLILGGTEFVGRAAARAALDRGWEVTVFHRGRHPAPAGAHELIGDRTEPGGLAALTGGGPWDAVLDTWSAAPSAVRDAARLLAGRTDRHVYVSSCSVYAWPVEEGYDEDTPVVDGSADAGDVPYAEAKRGGELAALDAYGADRSLLLRAGLIIGPWENVGRLPWWLGRIARGGPVLAPGPQSTPITYVDARDLAEWALDAAERGLSGPYNVVRQDRATIAELLQECVRATGAQADLRWTPAATVLDAGIDPWTELPVWIPRAERPDEHAMMHGANASRAQAAGLRIRPLAETVHDTWAWLRSLGGTAPHRPDRPPVGLPEEKEARVLGR
ncbi:NAD-dependent epimerase/dehydratase family protein [Streptomyces sp. HNM0663]|uniref:NAD-dependent epimerase/dehydratase family protein n=1 Tax=Streptomyces chengmaiensis TaxID=3040919 RepID=A0ABT6HK91_9ACTN|nr:NAD-dependent epimerase/dehydratase family protein [Streptomyces chengmaiensis]MDH2388705.1 NAD-dependent epimerase/dehydratase family protein [Streptomyces chengmaiensis]